MSMKLGAFTTFTPEYTFPEACQMIKALGFDGVQPRIVAAAAAKFDPAKPFNPWGNNKGGISEEAFFADPGGVLKPATDIGLQICSVASYASTADMSRAVAMVKACGKAGVRNVRIGAMPMPKDTVFDYSAYLDQCRSSYRELVLEAKKVRVRPCIELHMGGLFASASAAMTLLRSFAPDEVGILYDPGNMAVEGWEAPRAALNIMGPYLAEIHVKNARWVPDVAENGITRWKGESADLENGCVDWADVIAHLKAHGYDGWLIEEGHTHGRASYQRLQMAAELLRKLIG
jgi:sugar phosphate isomerase/epimerase